MYSKLSSKTRSTSYFTDFARGKRVKKAHGRHSKILAWQTGTGLPASHSMQGPASALVSVDQASHQQLLLRSANPQETHEQSGKRIPLCLGTTVEYLRRTD